MILLIVASILPYLLLVLGHQGEFWMPPVEQIVVSVSACAIYHVGFLFSCRKMGYSFMTVTWFFFWIFMGLAPLMCSLTGRWLWGDITFEHSQNIILAQGLCILFLAVFCGLHRYVYRRGWLSGFFMTGGTITDARLFLGLWFSLAASLLVLAGLGVQGTFFRTGYDEYTATGIFALFIQNFFRPMPLLIGVPMLWILLKDRLAFALPRTWLAMATAAIAIIVNFPLSVARFYGWTVICVFFYYLILHPKIVRQHWMAGLFILSGLLGSFVVNAARYARTAEDLQQSLNVTEAVTTESFYAGHVDAFELLVYGIDYVADNGTTRGRQTLGSILFWVPRTSWPAKPVPTGPLLGMSFINLMTQTSNTNLSAPIVLEGYIDLGAWGVVLLALIMGGLAGMLDRAVVERRDLRLVDDQKIYGIDAIAAPMLGLWVYLLRGSLMPAMAYSTGIVLAGLLMWKYFFRKSPGNTVAKIINSAR